MDTEIENLNRNDSKVPRYIVLYKGKASLCLYFNMERCCFWENMKYNN